MPDYKKGDRVKHRFGWTGTIVSGRIRAKDRRINVDRDDDDRIWAMVDMLEPLKTPPKP